MNHFAFYFSVGEIFVWGQNNFSQLGLGLPDKFNYRPQSLQCLQGLPIRQIACGGNHSFALTLSGAVFCWGRNSFGQLGVGHDKG
jgi:alpha-tubulin suppressor-like RCC1 family protein